MSNLFETAIVEKRNLLNEMRPNDLTLQELRLFTIYLSKINPYDKRTREVVFPLSDYQQIMGFGRLNISQLKESAKSLLSKSVFLPLESGGFDGFNIFKHFKFDKNDNDEWYVLIDASDDMLPYMFDFRERYFKYELWNALRLKSTNQIRMYEILKQYENLGRREIAVKDLQHLLGVNYKRWDRFKCGVLDSCQQALKEFTDICFDYERGKTGTGGKWLTIVFHISKNKDFSDPLTLSKFLKKSDIKKCIECSEDKREESQTFELYSSKKNENMLFYSGACDDEFTMTEIESLVAILGTMELKPHELGVNFAKYHFLSEQYSRFKAVAEHTHISNRYRYFYAMILAERDKQNE